MAVDTPRNPRPPPTRIRRPVPTASATRSIPTPVTQRSREYPHPSHTTRRRTSLIKNHSHVEQPICGPCRTRTCDLVIRSRQDNPVLVRVVRLFRAFIAHVSHASGDIHQQLPTAAGCRWRVSRRIRRVRKSGRGKLTGMSRQVGDQQRPQRVGGCLVQILDCSRFVNAVGY